MTTETGPDWSVVSCYSEEPGISDIMENELLTGTKVEREAAMV